MDQSLYIFLYADPGSGALILQLLIGFFLGLAFYVSIAFKRVKSLFLRVVNGVRGRRDDNETSNVE